MLAASCQLLATSCQLQYFRSYCYNHQHHHHHHHYDAPAASRLPILPLLLAASLQVLRSPPADATSDATSFATATRSKKSKASQALALNLM